MNISTPSGPAPERAVAAGDHVPAPILIVDDREDGLLALRASLEGLGEPIVAARSGEEALRWLLREQFAVILLDVYMPEMDCYETAALIKKLESTRSIPIIFLTAETTEHRHVELGYSTGAVDFLLKPFDPAMLRSKVNVFLELHRKNTQLEAQTRLLQAQLDELSRSRRALAEAQRIAQLGNWELDAETHAMTWSEPMRDLFRIGPDDPLPAAADVFDFLPAVLSAADTRFTARSTIDVGDEAPRIFLVSGEFVRGGAGQVVRVVGTHQDVTDYETSQRALAEATEALQREHHVVKVLQSSMAPANLPAPPGVQLAARYLPAEGVGGDWYDATWLPDGDVLLVIGDVAGHGIAAASLMNEVRIALRAFGQRDPSPASMLVAANRYLQDLDRRAMVTCLVAKVDPITGDCTVASAGHPAPVVDAGSGASVMALRPGAPLGAAFSAAAEHRFALPLGGRLLLYTDGLTDVRGASVEDRQAQLATACHTSATAEECVDAVLASMLDGRSRDDIALLAVQRRSDDDLDVTVEAVPAALAQVRAVMRRWFQHLEVGEPTSAELLLGAGELLANVCTHAYQLPGGSMRLEAMRRHDVVTIAVTDHGTWRDERDRGGGRGLDLAGAIADGLHIDALDGGGTRAVLTRQLPGTGARGSPS
jgi:CheY-like chemotaxis protein/anti-sigma regulatory factor (Ser/Thr protein kinase)